MLAAAKALDSADRALGRSLLIYLQERRALVSEPPNASEQLIYAYTANTSPTFEDSPPPLSHGTPSFAKRLSAPSQVRR